MVGAGAIRNHKSEAIAMLNSTYRRPVSAALAMAGLLVLTACSETTGRGAMLESYVSLFGQNERSASLPVVPVPEPRSDAARACQDTIVGKAKEYGAILVEAVSVGAPDHFLNGYTEVPIEMRIHYQHEERVEVRQARITCRVDALSNVVALLPVKAPSGTQART